MTLKGTARYNFFGSTVVENTTIESQSSVTVDFRWNDVGSIFRNSASNVLDCCTESCRWLKNWRDRMVEPMETSSAVDLTKAYLEEIQNAAKTQHHTVKPVETPNKSEAETSTFTSWLERGDLTLSNSSGSD
ncbi:hypothetical protein WMY93_023191 [Mugilogobius chulae]|uniref:Protein zwilch n=1 Tax=Mugilogobius chulae TaxID=88201 RepID=A0AAW0N8I2_9GOBI